MKRYYNPITGQLEYMPGFDDNSPLTVTEKLMEDGLKKKPLTGAELGINTNVNNKKIYTDLNLFGDDKLPTQHKPRVIKQKYKYELQKEVEDLKKQNQVLVKHQKPLPDDVEDVKYESVTGTFMGQSSNKKYTPKDAVSMNQQWDRVSPEDKNTLRMIQKTNYEYGNDNQQKPLWLDKAEKAKKNSSIEARTKQKRGGPSKVVQQK